MRFHSGLVHKRVVERVAVVKLEPLEFLVVAAWMAKVETAPHLEAVFRPEIEPVRQQTARRRRKQHQAF